MRKKEQKLIITFHTTEEAMEMEEFCRQRQIEGRLIPVPRSISAGCGLAWCTSPESRQMITNAIAQAGIKTQAIQECEV